MAKKGNPGIEEFGKSFPQAVANIEKDPLLTSAQKQAFECHMARYSGGSLKEHAEKFFRANQQCGPSVKPEPNEQFGSLQKKNDVVSCIARYRSLDVMNVMTTIASALALEDMTERIAKLRDELGDTPVASFLIWSFQNPHNPRKVYSGMKKDHLPCRLALDTCDPTQYYGIVHTSPDTPKRPTAFDAGCSDLWRPGGKTAPLGKCSPPYTEGLPEAVHSPCLTDDLADFDELL